MTDDDIKSLSADDLQKEQRAAMAKWMSINRELRSRGFISSQASLNPDWAAAQGFYDSLVQQFQGDLGMIASTMEWLRTLHDMHRKDYIKAQSIEQFKAGADKYLSELRSAHPEGQ